MEKLDILTRRLSKLNIDISYIGNYPWIYIDKINGKRVIEQFHGNHGFTIMFLGAKEFTDITEIFKVIRKYIKNE